MDRTLLRGNLVLSAVQLNQQIVFAQRNAVHGLCGEERAAVHFAVLPHVAEIDRAISVLNLGSEGRDG